jgi:polyhydroxyalkanoate synthesis regulator protein
MFKGKQIRKYNNRKLYSVTDSRHVTLKEVATFFTEGKGVIVQDAKTFKDLTVDTLVKALASVGYFDDEVQGRNLSNISDNLQEQGLDVQVK